MVTKYVLAISLALLSVSASQAKKLVEHPDDQ